MATAVSYSVTPEPVHSIYGSTFQQQTGPTLASSYHQGGVMPKPLGVSQQPLMGSSIYQSANQAVPLAPLYQYGAGSAFQGGSAYNSALQESAARAQANKVNDVATTTSVVSGVVPTGLYTSYVPASKIDIKAHERVASASKKPVTVYYTDDLYPPYYAKAKKVASTKKKTGCCA